MFDDIKSWIVYHLDFYGKYVHQQWAHVSPLKYGGLLIGIAVVGWCLMKSSTKRC